MDCSSLVPAYYSPFLFFPLCLPVLGRRLLTVFCWEFLGQVLEHCRHCLHLLFTIFHFVWIISIIFMSRVISLFLTIGTSVCFALDLQFDLNLTGGVFSYYSLDISIPIIGLRFCTFLVFSILIDNKKCSWLAHLNSHAKEIRTQNMLTYELQKKLILRAWYANCMLTQTDIRSLDWTLGSRLGSRWDSKTTFFVLIINSIQF